MTDHILWLTTLRLLLKDFFLHPHLIYLVGLFKEKCFKHAGEDIEVVQGADGLKRWKDSTCHKPTNTVENKKLTNACLFSSFATVTFNGWQAMMWGCQAEPFHSISFYIKPHKGKIK